MKTHLSQLLRWSPRPFSGRGRSRDYRSFDGVVRRRLCTEKLEDRMMLSADVMPYQNFAMPLDVNNDGIVSPLDALIIINDLNANGPRSLLDNAGTLNPDGGLTPVVGGDDDGGSAAVDPIGDGGSAAVDPIGEGAPTTYPDVNGDNFISPLDALLILNALNAEGAPGDWVEITLEATDNDGNLIGDPAFEVSAGEDFFVTVYVQDVRADATGVGIAYVDITYDDPIATPGPNAEVTYGAEFITSDGTDVTSTAGRIEAIGSLSTTAIGSDRYELVTIPFRADAVGTLALQTWNSDAPNPSVGVVDPDSVWTMVAPDDVDFGGLTITVVDSAWVDVTLEATDLDGNPISEVVLGSEFYVAVSVQDMRGGLATSGVKSAYIDMLYTAALATANPPIEYNGPYQLNQGGDFTTAGLIDWAGAGTDDVTLGATEQELMRVKFRADAVGTLILTTETGDPGFPSLDVFNEGGGAVEVGLNDINFGSLSIDVVEPVWIDVTLGATDLDGNPIDNLPLGGDFYVTVSVQDMRENPTGVSSAYIDLTYDETLVTPDGGIDTISYDFRYDTGQQGDWAITPGLIDDAGASTTDTTILGETVELMKVLFQADTLGTVDFAALTAVDLFSTIEVFDGSGGMVQVPLKNIQFGNLPIEVSQWVEVTLEATDLDGNPVDHVEIGDDFLVAVSVQDIRPSASASGVSSAYVDVTFDETLATPGTIAYGDLYDTNQEGDPTTTPGLIDDVGAATTDETIDGAKALLMTIPFRADAAGTLDLQTLVAGDPNTRITVFGATGEPVDVPLGAIKFDDVRSIDVGDWVEVTLEVTNPDGQVLSAVPFDSDFFVSIYVQDMRGEATGVSNALIDLQYTDALVTPTVDTDLITYGPAYDTAQTADTTTIPGRIDNAGAATTDLTLDSAKQLLMTIPFNAHTSGLLDLTLSSATGILPSISVFDETGTPERVPLDEIAFDSLTMDVGEVVIRLYATDNDGNLITEVELGETFLVKAYVKDIAAPRALLDDTGAFIDWATGVSAAYMDLIYDGERVEVVLDGDGEPVIDHGNDYTDQTDGRPIVIDNGNGTSTYMIDEAGGFSRIPQTLGSGMKFLFSTEFQAVQLDASATTTTLTFTADPADLISPENPLHDTILYGNDVGLGTPTVPANIRYGAVSIDVVMGSRIKDDSYTMNEDEILIVPADGTPPSLLANDFGPGGFGSDPWPVSIETGPAQAAVDGFVPNADGDGSFTYRPAPNFNGEDTFTYRGWDKDGTGTKTEETATVRITVLPVNDAPAAVADVYWGNEDTPLVVGPGGGVLANDTDEENGPLTAELVTGPENGQVTLNADGGFTYTPNADFTGADTFTYRASDGEDFSAPVGVLITVLPVNDAPVANPDRYEVLSNTTLVVADDVIKPGSQWKYLDDGSDQGVAWQTGTFNDAAWLAGSAELGYGDQDETTVVSYGDDPANKYATTYFRGTFFLPNASAVTAASLGLLRDDGAVVYVNGVEVARSNMPDGPIDYQTLADETVNTAGESVFYDFDVDPSVLVSGMNVIAVEIHQASLRSSDISFDLSLGTLTEQLPAGATVVSPTVLGNDVDVDGNNLFAELDSTRLPQNGQLVFDVDGSFTYVPDFNFFGRDYFYYRVTDGPTWSEYAEVEITVGDLAPSAVAGAVYVDVNDNGVHDDGERYLGDVELMLEGTNVLGEDVRIPAVTLADGGYQFGGLLPGSYTIRQQWQPEYMIDGQESTSMLNADTSVNDAISFTLVSSIDVVDANFGELGLRPEYITHRDSLASTLDSGIVVAIDALGDQLWYSLQEGWDGISRVNVSMSDSMETANVTVWDDAGREYRTSVSMYDTNRFRWLSYREEGSVLRLDGVIEDFNLIRVSQAEGEPVGPVEQSEAALLAALRPRDANYADAVDAVLRESAA